MDPKALFIEDHRDTVDNLKTGQIFSTSNFPISFSYMVGNDVITSQPEYIVYLGKYTRLDARWNHVLFLVVLKNGGTLIWAENPGMIELNLDRGRISKSNRKLIPPQLLQEIRNYFPDRKAAKENVKIVGTEVKLDEKDETPIHLPPNVKNRLLSFLAYFPKDSNQFQEDYTNILTKKPYLDELKSKQDAGKKKRTRKYRKSNKTRKTNKKKHLRKSRKSRKNIHSK